MPKFKKSKLVKIGIILVGCIALLIVVSIIGKATGGATGTFGAIYAPIENTAKNVTTTFSNLFNNIFGGNEAIEQNKELIAKIEKLEGENLKLQELEQENARLSELLDYKNANPGYSYVTAKVIAHDPGYWFDTFTISAGKHEGIKVDMGVITADGVIGKIVEVGANYSKVMSITDENSSISGIVERTRDTGIIQGSTDQDRTNSNLKMVYLPIESNLIPGDKVLTSGLGGIYPKGLPIGEVVEMSTKGDKLENYAIVKPYVSFSSIEEVLIVVGDKEGS